MFIWTLRGLLERDEARRVGGTDTGATVVYRLVGDGKLTEVVSDHLGLDLNLVEGLAVVDANNGSDHFWDNDHVAEVRLDNRGLVLASGGKLGLSQTLEERLGTDLDVALEGAAGTAVKHRNELILGQLQEILELNAAVRVRTERAFLAKFGNVGFGLHHRIRSK